MLAMGIALLLGGAAGCGAARPSKYYTLEMSTEPPAASNSYPVALLIGRIRAPQLYRDTRIVYRTGSTQMGTYEYHRWVEPPTDMLGAMLLHRLRASGKYRSVELLRSNARGDFILHGRLQELEEVDGATLAARVVMEIELHDPKTGAVVWSHFYAHDEPVNGKSVADVVEALSHNIQRGVDEVADGLDQYFAKNLPK